MNPDTLFDLDDEPDPPRDPRTWAPPSTARRKYEWPGEKRQPIRNRAGTILDHRFTEAVMGTGKTGTRQHGSLDKSQRVYQCGGEYKNFVYQKEALVTLDFDIWLSLQGKCDWLEWIDHEKNECWRVSLHDAVYSGRVYNDKLGFRYGIPIERFAVIDAQGYIVREPA